LRSRFRFCIGSSFALALLAVSPASFACSSCGCALSSDWLIQGAEGFHADFRLDYFNQSDLRSGSHRVDRGGIAFPADREIQQETINRNYTLFLDYAPEGDWGYSLQLPYVDRFHTTIAEGDVDVSASRSRSVGDARFLARFRGVAEDRSAGVQFGLKLPTGAHDVDFSSGPQAGQPLDRGLQPGTGTTDVVVGVYKFGEVADNLDYFSEAFVQQPLNSRDGFKPGTGMNVSFGARNRSFETVRPQLQINLRAEGRESGPNADVENSGATLVYFSPGVSVKVSNNVAAYGYVQVPIYQRVNGYQVEPKYSVSIGIRIGL